MTRIIVQLNTNLVHQKVNPLKSVFTHINDKECLTKFHSTGKYHYNAGFYLVGDKDFFRVNIYG